MAILSEQSMACVTLNFCDKGGHIFCYTIVVILQLLYNHRDSSRSLTGWHLSSIRDIGRHARLPPFFFWSNAMYSLLCAKEITKKRKFKTKSISDYKLIKRDTNLQLWNFVFGERHYKREPHSQGFRDAFQDGDLETNAKEDQRGLETKVRDEAL